MCEKELTRNHIIQALTTPMMKDFGNTVEKGENAAHRMWAIATQIGTYKRKH